MTSRPILMVGRIRDDRVHILDLAYEGPCLARLLGHQPDLSRVIAEIDPTDLREIDVLKSGIRHRLGAIDRFRAGLTLYEPWRPPVPPPVACAPRRRRRKALAAREEQILLPLDPPEA